MGWVSSLASNICNSGIAFPSLVFEDDILNLADRSSYREQVEKVSRLKEETVRAIVKNSHDIAMFKDEVSRHLRDLREFAEMD